MKILIYGAGVIGSIYAARLYNTGCDVTLLARGKHYESLKTNGVMLKDILTGKLTTSKVPLTLQLATKDFYDLIIVTVRLDQIDTVMPILKRNTVCPLVMFMLNNPENTDALAKELKQMHITLGFPGVGGTYQNNIIDYIQIKQQETTIGETNGEKSVCIKEIKKLFETAGFNVSISAHIEDWLKIHAVFVACITAAIIRENGDSVQLGKKRSSVKILVQSIIEGFTACKTLGISITPTNLKVIFMVMPQWFSICYWQRALRGKVGTLAMAPHANRAQEEMKLLAEKVLTIVHSSSFPTPTLDALLSSFINSKQRFL
jgi:2-dehydropantoate 2-reductase